MRDTTVLVLVTDTGPSIEFQVPPDPSSTQDQQICQALNQYTRSNYGKEINEVVNNRNLLADLSQKLYGKQASEFTEMSNGSVRGLAEQNQSTLIHNHE